MLITQPVFYSVEHAFFIKFLTDLSLDLAKLALRIPSLARHFGDFAF